MQPIEKANFGFLIAYLLPGYLAFSVAGDVIGLGGSTASIGGIVNGTAVSLVYGMVINAVRWLAVDRLHHLSGIKPKKWSFSKLQKNIDAFEIIVRHQYQYYQFYANTFVAGCFSLVASIWQLHPPSASEMTGGIMILTILFIASRNTLAGYYSRVDQILGRQRS